jgi:hypothetical protein
VFVLGYAYAHSLSPLIVAAARILAHVGLMLPFAPTVASGAGVPPPSDPLALWLLMRLAPMVGPVVQAIEATAPTCRVGSPNSTMKQRCVLSIVRLDG